MIFQSVRPNLIQSNRIEWLSPLFVLQWCRSGICVLKTAAFEKYTALTKPTTSDTSEKTNLIDERKFSNLMKSEHSMNRPSLVNYEQEEEDEEEDNDIEVLDLIMQST